MNERSLLRISAIVFIVGIISLSLVLLYLSPVDVTTSDLQDVEEGKYVKVKGTVSDLFFSESGISFNVDDGTGTVKVFIFSSTVRSMLGQGIDILSLGNGDSISVSGTLMTYHGEREIIPKSYEDVVVWS